MIKHVANLMEWASPYGCWAALVFLLLQINGAKGGVVHVAGLLGSMRWVAGAVNVAPFHHLEPGLDGFRI